MEKMTKRNVYSALINFVENGSMTYETESGVYEVAMEDLRAFAEKEIANLDKKSAYAKTHASKKKNEMDELADRVLAALTNDYMTIADVTVALNDENVTVSKVSYRLNKLVESGAVEKTDVKVPTGEGKKTRSVKAYRLVQE